MSTLTVPETQTLAPMRKCDGCPAKAKVRLRVWDTWPTYLDLCNHHGNKARKLYPNVEVLEQRDD